MSEEKTFSRGEAMSPAETRKAKLDARLDEIFSRRKSELELAGPQAAPQAWWDIYAIGPSQGPGYEPARVIEVGEEAHIELVVRLNETYPPGPGQTACELLTSHNDKIEIFIYTSNMQTMQPEPGLTYHVCVYLTPGQCEYRIPWDFTPQRAACLYEVNICARVCNCNNQPLPQFSGFVWWVQNLDYDWFFEYQEWTFDHPIRFMVSDPSSECDCPPPP